MNFKFEHSCIRVLDLEKSIEFYQKALNLKISARKDNPEHLFTLVYLTNEDGNFELELTHNHDRVEPYEIGTGYSHLCMKVEDVIEAHKYHKGLGFECTDLKRPTGTNYVYFITDPDGYKIEIL